ncbi:MAG: hypothetical protein QOD90_4921 [Mycobacterium sp.]|jgi:hypothetical protein|nr:hypothetical protein [Mycobacterium sp.]
MTTYVIPLLTVLIVGLVLGAGLPAVFALGLVSYSAGAGGTTADGAAQSPNPALKFFGLLLFAVVGFVVFVAILWITRSTIIHHTGFDPFFGFKK